MRVLTRTVSLSPDIFASLPITQRAPRLARFASTLSKNNGTVIDSLSPRWLSELTSRIGKCIMFGLDAGQVKECGCILKEVVADWRELLAGSEGFLTGKDQRGLYRQEVVWGEMHGHVNNVVYNRYAESARVNWALGFSIRDPSHGAEWKSLMTPKGIGMILRSIRTDYKFPMKYPDHVTVLHKLRDRPQRDSDHFILDVLILSERHRRAAAKCVEDIVVYDYRAGRKSAMPGFMVERLQATFDLQEQARQAAAERIRGLLGRVRALEQGSWDRVGAVEDLGSAGQAY